MSRQSDPHNLSGAKAPRPLIQLDGYVLGIDGGDNAYVSDEQGHCVLSTLTDREAHGANLTDGAVRVFVSPDIRLGDAKALLKKIRRRLSQDLPRWKCEFNQRRAARVNDPFGESC